MNMKVFAKANNQKKDQSIYR